MKMRYEEWLLNKSMKKITKKDKQIKLNSVKGILKNRIPNPIEYQQKLRDEWERI